LLDVGFSLCGRSVFEHRAVVFGGSVGEVVRGLGSLAVGESAGNVIVGRAGGPGEVAFLFPGQGSQWVGMALGLLGCSPVFAELMGECERALAPHVDFRFGDVLRGVEGAPGLDRVDVVQPALFAVMVSLAGLWRACGVRPGVVVGHSQGEIAAACVAGALSLEDAARVIALRSRALASLAGEGGMVSVAAGVREVLARLERWSGRLSLAAVNGPASVVVSGDVQALEGLLGECEAEGVRARMIPVDYAAHSQRVEAIEGELMRGCSGIEPHSSDVPFLSTVTGELLDTAELDGGYWYRNLRQTVQFERATRAVLEQGRRVFVEVSPHPVLTMGVQETAERVLADSESVTAIGSVRREDGGLGRFLRSLAELWVCGGGVDWGAVFEGAGAKRVGLPTYAFQRERYWLKGQSGGGDPASLGQVSADHPLLGAALPLADGEGWLFTGRLSLESHPWLRDHAVLGSVLLPGTGFLELALRAGREVGCEMVEELTQESPLLLSEKEAFQLQVTVGEPDQTGRRPISIHSRPERTAGDLGETAEQWTRNASGLLAVAEHGQPAALPGSWPPAQAEPVEADYLYENLVDMGFELGPVFQGVTAAWRRGDEFFAEICLPDSQQAQAGSFGVHPALFDAALQTALLALLDGDDAGGDTDNSGTEPLVGRIRIPFSWSKVSLGRMGASRLRARLAPVVKEEASSTNGDGATAATGVVSLVAVDESGAPVISVRSLVTRPVSAVQLSSVDGGYHESLFDLEWVPLALDAFSGQAPSASPAGAGEETARWVVLGSEDSPLAAGIADAGAPLLAYSELASLREALDEGAQPPPVVLVGLGGSAESSAEPPELVHEVLSGVLALMQSWLADDRLTASRLVLVTDGAVAAAVGEDLRDLSLAPLWGLARSAQSENPERFVLVDVDGAGDSWRALLAALAAASAVDEPQLAVRGGEVLSARLKRVARGTGNPNSDDASPAAGVRSGAFTLTAERSVLITGGTGELGGLLARHLVAEHGVRSLVLASRRGMDAPGAAEIERELESLGALVTIAACDVSEREQLQVLLSSIPPEFPLGAVIHAAGALDDGVIASLSPERLDRVLAPKAHAAWHLHELTEHLDLEAFVMFSSVAATIGSPGQGNYAASNAFLDALAVHRRRRGLPAISMAWGFWEQLSELTGDLSEADLARMRRVGLKPLSSAEGLKLFDAALNSDEALVLPIHLDIPRLRAQARSGPLPPLLRGLISVPPRRTADSGSLARKLAGVPEAERESVALELIRTHIATVLGHTSPASVDPQLTFKELGFDSLTAVELRNRLNTATDLHLPATLIFDYPSPGRLAPYLVQQVTPASDALPRVDRDETSVRAAIASIPLATLQASGLLEHLVQLANITDISLAVSTQDRREPIDTMDVDGLVRLAEGDVSDSDPVSHG
jgi:acyl transferase domain-containing protein/acyl carrier protein